MIIRVPALGPPPSPVTDVGLRGVRLGRILWRPLLRSVSSAVMPVAVAVGGAADGSSLDATIHPAAAWSDGEPVLARDVVSSVAPLAVLAGIDVIELADRRVRFTGGGAARFASSLVPVRMAEGRPDLTITSGPYRLASIDGSRAVLLRTEEREIGSAVPETLEFVGLEDVRYALDELRRGHLDVVLEADEAVVADIIAAPGPAVLALPDMARVVQVLGFNAERRPLTPAVRAELTRLIDREALAGTIYHGLALAGLLPMDAGVAVPTGKTDEEVVILVNCENRLRVAAADKITAIWARAGAAARVDAVPWGVFTRRLQDGDFDCFLISVRDTGDKGAMLGRLTRSQSGDESLATEVTVHAQWAALTPGALRYVPLLVAVTGGGVTC